MVRFLSFNVKGLNSDIKRCLTLQVTVFPQEIHFPASGFIYLATACNKAACVAIMISCSCPYQLSKIESDPQCPHLKVPYLNNLRIRLDF